MSHEFLEAVEKLQRWDYDSGLEQVVWVDDGDYVSYTDLDALCRAERDRRAKESDAAKVACDSIAEYIGRKDLIDTPALLPGVIYELLSSSSSRIERLEAALRAISNMAHLAWTDKANIQVMFEMIEKLAGTALNEIASHGTRL